ncbi:hypothetical protein ETAA8_64550 [Anatilimnocola aggregata]|uniref:DUF2752 domain-containing protein n=1 Tax=Anatilimnocola aggregata TaxID=2528021 RepID=A0A517YM54_9BACT|nr:DUF2752 domain-containing protein [Anatilimnocola aggregata]QDU31302.1 hypothetical protein ETAA8_64550 [Anatilimnocola aggregata]
MPSPSAITILQHFMSTPFPTTWSPPEPLRIALWQRALLLVVGLALGCLLVTAALLPPSEYGMGTHQQLGLPPCSFVMWFDLRCPACGMTTSWAHLMRGQIIRSAVANTGGCLLGIFAALSTPWLLASAIRGRWLFGPLSPEVTLWVFGSIFLVTLVQWAWRIL